MKEEILKIARDHYWDTFQEDKDIILAHLESILNLADDKNQSFIDTTAEENYKKGYEEGYEIGVSNERKIWEITKGDEIKKIKNRFRCGACDGAKCEHTQGCQALEKVLELITKK